VSWFFLPDFLRSELKEGDVNIMPSPAAFGGPMRPKTIAAPHRQWVHSTVLNYAAIKMF
jgi:hypothetical protein